MQNHRRELKSDKRGIAGLPLKLLVTMVILCIAIPVIVNAVESSEDSMLKKELDTEADRIRDAVAVVYYAGEDSARTLEFDIPQGCTIEVGGEGSDAFSIRCSVGGELVSTKYFEKPMIGFEDCVEISGKCVLKVTNIGNNEVGLHLI